MVNSALYDTLAELVTERATRKPFLVGVAGAVSVGKTTMVRILAEGLTARGRPAQVLSTDAFLLPNRILNERGLMTRKGFPETYDHEAIETVMASLRARRATAVHVYSHDVYDVLPDVTQPIGPADIVLIEGIVALQQPIVRHLDLALYIDAPEATVRQWYVARFIGLVAAAKNDSASFYQRFAGLPQQQLRELAGTTWDTINAPNLHDHIAPSVACANVIVVKAADHSIVELRVQG